MLKSYINGNVIIGNNNGRFRYVDGEPTLDREGNEVYRPCPKCKRLPSEKGHDFCLKETLPGVHAACCGHGVREGYILFENGVRIEFDKITDRTDRHRGTYIHGNRIECSSENDSGKNCTYDDGTPIADEEGNIVYRPCPKCKGLRSDKGYDSCFKQGLPGVHAACCGHDEKAGYILFENGAKIKFNKITEITNLWRGDKNEKTS